MSGNHFEHLLFHVIDSPQLTTVLGYPWLQRHKQTMNWLTGSIVGWSTKCHSSCLLSASTDVLSKPPAMETRRFWGSLHIPGPQGDFPEREAMSEYIQNSLDSGIICPSSSPAGAVFFFVGKKDKTLRPCIDHRGLNITFKNRYPLSLISSAFELLQGASIFTKLDLRNAYHLVRIRKSECKTVFNTPSGHYDYLVRPNGITNAPAVFQALVNDVLRDMLIEFVYLDDILIFFKDQAGPSGHAAHGPSTAAGEPAVCQGGKMFHQSRFLPSKPRLHRVTWEDADGWRQG